MSRHTLKVRTNSIARRMKLQVWSPSGRPIYSPKGKPGNSPPPVYREQSGQYIRVDQLKKS